MSQIDENNLKDMLFRRKKHIKTNLSVWETLICLASFILLTFLSDVFNADLKIKIGVGIAGAIYFIAFACSLYGANYSVDAFYEDICSVAENEHNFSLLLLIDSSGLYPENLLLAYEKRWKCYLFPFLRTNINDDEKSVKNYVANFLGIKEFSIKKISEENFTKHSVSANLQKTYHHTFYSVCFDAKKYSKGKRAFKLNRQKYKWFTIPEMKADKNIIRRNKDNVEYIEKTFIFE